jgi:hypothetical protein
MTIAGAERVTAEEAERRGVEGLLDDAARHPIAVTSERRQPVLMLSSDAADDLFDAVLMLSRRLTDHGDRATLQEFVAELGLTQAEIDAADA